MDQTNIPKNFDSEKVEPKIYKIWEEAGIFNPEKFEKHLKKKGEAVEDKKPFVMTLPPPNANGDLHVGHTCGYSFQDAMGRFARLHGRPTLLLPGKDHASIQTEAVYARKLKEEGKSKWDMGREKFVESCYNFCMEKSENARKQEKRIGLSADWSRELFTLDDSLTEVIYDTFFNMFEDGLIYRGKYIINQCTHCRTALADVDTEHEEKRGIMARIIYPFVDERDCELAENEWDDKEFEFEKDGEKIDLDSLPSTKGVTVATTRPETMLGDTAVAVNPKDPRYKEFIGKKVRIPETDREIEIIADSEVDMTFGTGALKVTPAHSPTDFEIGRRNNLEIINVIGEDGKMIEPVPEKYVGMETVECSKTLVKNLDKQGLLVDIENFKHEVSVCERCGTTIQPIMSNQWFINVKPLAEKAIEVLDGGETTVLPEGKQRALRHFLDNIIPWCISRQLWWGQRIPIWYSGGRELFDFMVDELSGQSYELSVHAGKIADLSKDERAKLVKRYEKQTGKEAKGTGILFAQEDKPEEDPYWEGDQEEVVWEQEEDIFDTWFSSGQWPYSTLGGPGAEDFKKYYPTDVMETMYDILYMWVARMMMLGIYRTGDTPFETVYLHGKILAKDGTKMSKSKGNGVSPMKVINEYGADALRLWYLTDTLPGSNTPLRTEKLKGGRNFVNKIWNAFRFVLMNVEEGEKDLVAEKLREIDGEIRELEDGFDFGDPDDDSEDGTFEIKEHFYGMGAMASIRKVDDYVNEFRFNLAALEMREFFWHVICDKWIEEVKSKIDDMEIGSESRVIELAKLVWAMREYLKIMHPFVPFITEAVWQELVDYGLAEGILASQQLIDFGK